MKLVLSSDARLDLIGIGDWIAQDSRAQAASFVEELNQRCRGLTTLPSRYPVVVRRGGREIRRCVHGDYLILFEIDTLAQVVNVLHIVHGARDYEALLSPEGSDG